MGDLRRDNKQECMTARLTSRFSNQLSLCDLRVLCGFADLTL
jgi:hypothetical protein